PSPLSLQARVSVSGPWSPLPLSQAQQDLFGNSSLLSCSQPLLLLPLAGPPGPPTVQASLCRWFMREEYSRSLLPLSPLLSASLLTAGEENGFLVRVLFHWRGTDSRGRCVTLHAFKATQELRAACLTEAPLGVCVASLPLPSSWLKARDPVLPAQKHTPAHRHKPRRHRGSAASGSSPMDAQVQLYYSDDGPPALMDGAPPSCLEARLERSQSKLYYTGAPPGSCVGAQDRAGSDKQEDASSLQQAEEELWLDPDVFIRYQRGPARFSQPVAVSVRLRSNFSADFVVIRLKVKKGQMTVLTVPVMTSGLWVVAMEKSVGAKQETTSLICHRLKGLTQTLSSSLYQEVACISLQCEGDSVSKGAVSRRVFWRVEYSGHNNPMPPLGGTASLFTFSHRDIVGIAPITETASLINTAILTGQPVSLPVTVLAVGHDGKVSDVTSAVTCHSADEDIIKVSSDCSTLFVDGSESGRGGVCAGVEFSLGSFSASLCLSVWVPQLPLTIALSDSQLSQIDGWTAHTETGCSPVYQRSTVQIWAQFAAMPVDARRQVTYLLGSPDWFVDVTALARHGLRVENPRVASLDEHGILIGLEPGVTSLQVVSSQWDSVLGESEVTVSADPVKLGDLKVQLVSGLTLSITASPSHPSVITATVSAQHILYTYGQQEASLSIWLQFSDDTLAPLAYYDAISYSLRLTSLAESVVSVVTAPPGSQPSVLPQVVARGDGGGPLLRAELLPRACPSQPPSTGEVGAGLPLARGSGWVRVNLDHPSRPAGAEDMDFELLEISDFFLEPDSEMDQESFAIPANDSHPGHTQREESAVLSPHHVENGVFAPNGSDVPLVPREGKKQETEELKVGLAALLSLLCLSALLFLVNCVPCTLRQTGRDRGTKRSLTEGEGQRENEEAEDQ
uniref:Uncharacterized protein n=1 Tax=Lepisosteus oculatus TaxID=7918 RepID=W5MNM3_LEPOC